MNRIDNQDLNARLAYETIMGRRVTDRHWHDIKKLLTKHNLPVSVENVQFFAEIRKIIPRSSIGVTGILKCYEDAQTILAKATQPIKGEQVLNILRQYQVVPHQTTVSRWFRCLGGYRRNRQYSPKELKPILTNAFIYKAHHSLKLQEVPHESVC